MTFISVVKAPQALFPATGQSIVVINTDPIHPVYVAKYSAVTTSDDQIPPLGSVAFDGIDVWYASSGDDAVSIPVDVLIGAEALTGPPSEFVSLEPFSLVSLTAGQSQTIGPFAVGTYRSIIAGCRNITGQIQITVHFAADPAGLSLISGPTWMMNSAAALLTQVPVLGPYASIVIRETSGSAAASADVTMVGTANSAQEISYPNQLGSHLWTAQSIAAGTATAFQIPGPIRKGTWYAYFKPADGTGSLLFQVGTVNAAGVVQSVIDDLGTPAATLRATGPAPDGTNMLAVIVTNSDAVNPHSFTGALTIID